MRTGNLGSIGAVSRLALGGGIGQIWGEVTHEEALATIHAAIDAGITLLDSAPGYRNAEGFIGEALAGRPPAGLKFTTKCNPDVADPREIPAALERSLGASLEALRLPRVDVFFLHTSIHADDFVFAHGDAQKHRFSTSRSAYDNEVAPTMQRLKDQGRIGAWGITGIGVPSALLEVFEGAPRAASPLPDVVQVIANLMDSAGALRRYAEPARPRDIAAAAKAKGLGVMGIRAVQAGALTAAVDRQLSPNSPDRADYDRAAPFRALCADWGQDPAYVAHRYALSLPDFDTLVLGVKNRAELAMGLAAEADGPYSAAEMAAIDGLGLARPA